MPNIRTFIALPASESDRKKMAEIQSGLMSAQSDVKWESENKFHITLKFLGNVEQSKIERMSLQLSEQIAAGPPLEINYISLGAFPDIRSPRIVWIGTDHNEALLALQAKIDQVCIKFGFQKEDREFHPHITIGRVKSRRNLARLTEAIKTITFDPIHSKCYEVLLMKSDLSPGGSIYSILKSFSLQMQREK
jgi:2'-5' RNA ligase